MYKSKKSQSLSIEFLVKFILAIILFALGVILIWSIYTNGKDMMRAPETEISNRIFALNCNSKQDICIGANTLHMKPGDKTLVDVKLFNNLDVDLNVNANLQRINSSNVEDVSPIVVQNLIIKNTEYQNIIIPAKGDNQFSFAIILNKQMPRGAYVIKINMNREAGGVTLDPKIKRINLYVE
jgi:hypothetical protein